MQSTLFNLTSQTKSVVLEQSVKYKELDVYDVSRTMFALYHLIYRATL